jgi:hypothetical protein
MRGIGFKLNHHSAALENKASAAAFVQLVRVE